MQCSVLTFSCVFVFVGRHDLVEGGLLHDSEELVLVDLSVAVPVGLIDHLLELLVGHVLSELLGNTLEVAKGNLR